jgi:hypothetical protein
VYVNMEPKGQYWNQNRRSAEPGESAQKAGQQRGKPHHQGKFNAVHEDHIG